MSKWHSERCESRSKNNLRNNSKGITTTKSKLSTHDRLCTLVLTPVKTSVHDVTFSEWQWMQLIRINCLINQKKEHDENNVSAFFIFLSICCYLLDN